MGNYSRGDEASLPSGVADLETLYDGTDLAAVVTAGDSQFATQTATDPQIPIHQYKDTVTAPTVDLTWTGQSDQDCEDYPVNLQVYKFSTTTWETVATNNTTTANTNFTLQKLAQASSGYVDGSNVLTSRVYQSSGLPANSMRFTINMTGAGTFTLPINDGGDSYTHNFTADWGDTSSSTITAYDDADRVHTYAGAGNYTITIYGTCEYFCFNNTGDCAKVTAITGFNGDIGFKLLNFFGCSNLTSAVALGTKASLEAASSMFRGCSSLAAIPTSLFDGCSRTGTNNTDFDNVFRGCSTITSIPTDLFKYATKAVTFADVFDSCTALTSIPTDIFRYNTIVTNFSYAFVSCTSITSVPTDTFRYNTAVTTFAACFNGCSQLATVSADLFKYNTVCTSFAGTFQDCIRMQEHATIFYGAGESGTRFHDQTVDFSNCFRRNSWAGASQGTAPDLWNCDYGTGTPTKTQCWLGDGNSTTSLSNYASIPSDWIS